MNVTLRDLKSKKIIRVKGCDFCGEYEHKGDKKFKVIVVGSESSCGTAGFYFCKECTKKFNEEDDVDAG